MRLNQAESEPMRRYLTASLIMTGIMTSNAFAVGTNISPNDVNAIELGQIKSTTRVVALANGSAEIIAALGLRSTIVGRDVASTTPELISIPIVTSGHQVIAEKVISLKPSLVLIDANVGPKSAIDAIKSSKIKVVTITQAWSLADIRKRITQIGDSLGVKTRADELNAQITKANKDAKNSIGWKPKVLFLYLRGPSSIYLIGGPGSGADSLIQSLGGVDVGASTLKNPFNTLTSEALVKANPDVLLVMTKGLQSVGGVKGLLALPGVGQTNAGRSQRFLSVDDSLLLSFGPRTPALLQAMAKALKALK